MDLDAGALDLEPTEDDIEEAVADHLPLEDARVAFARWMVHAWEEYTDTAADITVGQLLASGLRDWRGQGTPRPEPPLY